MLKINITKGKEVSVVFWPDSISSDLQNWVPYITKILSLGGSFLDNRQQHFYFQSTCKAGLNDREMHGNKGVVGFTCGYK